MVTSPLAQSNCKDQTLEKPFGDCAGFIVLVIFIQLTFVSMNLLSQLDLHSTKAKVLFIYMYIGQDQKGKTKQC